MARTKAIFDDTFSKPRNSPTANLPSAAHGSESKNAPKCLWGMASLPPQGEEFDASRGCQRLGHSTDNPDALGKDRKSYWTERNSEIGEDLRRPRCAVVTGGEVSQQIGSLRVFVLRAMTQ